ncbi:MAG: hypothetical protein JWO67_4005 [Streptosporangiaceae bacterium]|nr:hypothetical protein [Streptosporangiaceae bacterium]
MSTNTESTTCWRLVLPNGKDYDQGDGIPHFDTEREATAEISGRELSTGTTAQKLPTPCVTTSCDECEIDLGGDDVFTRVHHDDVTQAHEIARKSDWKITPDGRTYCWDCPIPESIESGTLPHAEPETAL